MAYFRMSTKLLTGAILLLFGTSAWAQTPPAASEPSLTSVVEDLVIANHILADQGVMDAFGHVSVRHPTKPDHFLMSRNLAPALVTSADIVEYDFPYRNIFTRPAGVC